MRRLPDSLPAIAAALVCAAGLAVASAPQTVRAHGPENDPGAGGDSDHEHEEAGEPGEGATRSVQLNDEQKRLNNKAVEAITGQSKNPEAAIRYLKAALLVGPKGNVLYMALGRAHQLKGDCGKATEMFDQALKAPQVASVKPTQILARIEKYRGDLEKTCPGRLTVDCSSSAIELSVAGKSFECGTDVELSPGTYTVEATLRDLPKRTRKVDIVSMRTRSIRFEFGIDAAHRGAMHHVSHGISRARSAQLAAYRVARKQRRLERTRSDAEEAARHVDRKATDVLGFEERKRRDRADETTEPGGEPDRERTEEREADRDDEPKEESGPEGFLGFVVNELRWVFTVRLPVGIYVVQLEDGDTGGGFTYGGTGIVQGGYEFSDFWTLEDRLQFDWQYPLSTNTNPDSIDLRTWRLQNDVRMWLKSVALGMFLDYRHQTTVIGEEDREETTGTFTMGPSVVLSSRPPFEGSGHFRFYARWGLLFQGSASQYQFGLDMATKNFVINLEYERLTGEHSSDEALRRGELLMLNVGARFTL